MSALVLVTIFDRCVDMIVHLVSINPVFLCIIDTGTITHIVINFAFIVIMTVYSELRVV